MALDPVEGKRATNPAALLVEWYHRKYLHVNGEIVLNEMRHIPGHRTLQSMLDSEC